MMYMKCTCKRLIPTTQLKFRVEFIEPTTVENILMPFLGRLRFIGGVPYKGQTVEPFDHDGVKKLVDESINPLILTIDGMKVEVQNLRTEILKELSELEISQNFIFGEIKRLLGEQTAHGRDDVIIPDSDVEEHGHCENISADVTVSKGTFVAQEKGAPNVGEADDKIERVKKVCGKDALTEFVSPKRVSYEDDIPSFALLSQDKLADNVYIESHQDDDLIFTTQEIHMIDKLSAGKDPTMQKYEDILNGDMIRAEEEFGRGKRTAVKSAYQKSPFMTNFGSDEQNKYEFAGKQLVVYQNKNKKIISAFPEDCLAMPAKSNVDAFDIWYKEGYHPKRSKVAKFSGRDNIIHPPFSFVVSVVTEKMWFYNLLTPDCWLDNDYINVAFYYLRKLGKYSSNVSVRITTVDSWFHTKLTNLYAEFNLREGDRSVLYGRTQVAEYILGYLLSANTPWSMVDYVMFPIIMKDPAHWFLLILDIHNRVLRVYNTFQPTRSLLRGKIRMECAPYCIILPKIMEHFGFWRARDDVDFTLHAFKNKKLDDDFKVIFESDVPEQVQGDCGVYTIGMAEYFMFGQFQQFKRIFCPSIQEKALRVFMVACYDERGQWLCVGFEISW